MASSELLDGSQAVLSQRSEKVDDGRLPRLFSLRFSTRGISLAVNAVILLQLTFYATDIVGLSAGLVGGLFLAAKLFDGVTDLVVGFVIDRTNTRWGKARPYELFLIPLWILTVALFSTPDMDPFWQAAYIFVMFVLIQSVCVTALAGAEAVYLKRSVSGDERFAKVLSRQGVLVIIVAAIGSIILPQLMATWGTQPGGFTLITLVYGVPMLALGLIRFFTIKERPEDSTDLATEERLGLRESIRALLKNRFVMIMGAMILLANVVINVNAVVGAYFFKYVLGDLGLLSVIGLAGLVVPFLYLLFPLAVRTIGAINFIRIGLLLAIIGFGIVFLAPGNLVAVLVGQTLGSLTTIVTILVGFFVIQTMSYGEWKTGKRIDAMTNSVVSFSGKVGAGLASGLVGIIMGVVGYNGLADTQTPAAESAIVTLYSLVPLLLAVGMLVLTFFYRPLDKNSAAINSDLRNGVTSDTSSITI